MHLYARNFMVGSRKKKGWGGPGGGITWRVCASRKHVRLDMGLWTLHVTTWPQASQGPIEYAILSFRVSMSRSKAPGKELDLDCMQAFLSWVAETGPLAGGARGEIKVGGYAAHRSTCGNE